jgi:feruloyl esterase
MGGVSNTSSSVRLFMAPGMGHCGGGNGPNVFGKVDRTRPSCPHPQVARYKNTGCIDDAANFACAAP